MKLTLGFSPCPNDTFIFDALVNKKIDTEGFEFVPALEDVETLNQWALKGKLDITKLSFPAFFRSTEHYILLNSGSALGKGVGPLLVSNKDQQFSTEEINSMSVALPGVNTTAHLLFGYAYPEASHKKFMIFSAIEDAVAGGETDLGVIIHENRFTYPLKGLHKVADLGETWEQKNKVPIPLGGIAINQSIKRSVAVRIDSLIRKSLEYAFAHYPIITDYVKEHSQAMSEEVMRQHIDLYVNNFSLDLGTVGKNAITVLFHEFQRMTESNEDVDPDTLFL